MKGHDLPRSERIRHIEEAAFEQGKFFFRKRNAGLLPKFERQHTAQAANAEQFKLM